MSFFPPLEWNICYLFNNVNAFYLHLESTAVSWHPAIKYLDLPLCNTALAMRIEIYHLEPILNSVASKSKKKM